ncbi:MAG: pitrilysin family protein [Steroidobacteraceae bacterium]
MKLLRTLALLSLGLALATQSVAGVTSKAVRASVEGMDVVIVPTDVKDVVTITGSMRAGDDRSPPDNVAIATLTGSMLDKGTTAQDKFAIAQRLGGVGAALHFSVGASALQISGKCLRKDLPLVTSLLAEQLRQPAFPEAELDKLKKQLDGAMRQQMEDTDFRAGDAFSRAVFPPGHPNRQPAPDAFIADVGKATVEQLRQFHSQYYGPAAMRLVIVGDVDPAATIDDLRRAFSGWTGGSAPPPVPDAPPLAAAKVERVAMPDKTSVSVVMGQPTQLRYSDPDSLALRMGTRILGSGFTGRLMSNVRDKEGLTYGIGSVVSDDTYADGDWSIYATFAPPLLDKGVASTKKQLALWHDHGVTAAELARSKTRVAGSYKVGLATTSGLAGTILLMLDSGMPLEFVDEYPQRVDALTLEQVNAAIRKHIDPDKLVLVEAGTLPGAAGNSR